MQSFSLDLDFEKFSGLLPVIAQEHGSGRVLMLLTQILKQSGKHGKTVCSLLVKVKEYSREKKVKVPDMFRKSLRFWWIG
ncbi:MAG: hypothetical protein Ct9H300mP28_21250 [Pseudomonadota bacterium]|nr:MAG: hypothetical protein Ct9H300mP28_21250 [Pseudomonadota bacterium]